LPPPTVRATKGYITRVCFNAILVSFAFFLFVEAQEAVPEKLEELEEFIITGSRISRSDFETSNPVITFDRNDIERTGFQTVSDILRNLPYQSGFSFDEKFTNSFAPGASGVSLRGLGQDATLVLINGRRVANHGFALDTTDTFVDLNSIPLGAIERIEVLKTGASAIYGSDAIAGVINLITRKDYEGSNAGVTYSNTSRGDMSEFSANASLGIAGNRGNLLITTDYYRRYNLKATDRFFSKSADQSFRKDGMDFRSFWGFPGWIFLNGQFLDLPPPESFATPGHPTEEELLALEPGIPLFDFAPFIDLLPSTERYGIASFGEYEITDALTVFSTLSYNKVETLINLAPTPDSAFLDGRFVAADNPFNPLDEPFTFGSRFVGHGGRKRDLDTDVVRALIGLKGTLRGEWEWESAFLWNRSNTTNTGRNFHSDPAVREALASTDPNTALNIFSLNLNLKDALTVETLRTGDSRLKSFDFVVKNNSFLELSAGSVGFAAGAEYRDESLEDMADPLTTSGQIIQSGGTSSVGSRDLYSFYAELVLPVTESIVVDAAIRHESYSDFGDTTNPRFGLRYHVNDWLMLRGVFDEGFRAPSLAELHLGETVSFLQVNDPQRPSDTGNFVRTVSGGNPDLQPETSDTHYFGVVIEPTVIPGLSLALDFTRIKHNNIIGDLNENFILQNEASLPGFVVRAPFENSEFDRENGNTAGPILSVNNRFGNFGNRRTNFLDLESNYEAVTDAGTFEFFVSATYMADFKQQFRPGEEFIQRAGTNRLPRYRGNIGGTWDRGDFSVSTIIHYIHSFEDPARDTPVGSFYEINPQVTYRGLWNTKITLGVQNLLDRHPPWTADVYEGFNLSIHNPVMRRIYLSLKTEF